MHAYVKTRQLYYREHCICASKMSQLSAHTSIYSISSKVIHIINVSVSINLPETCVAPTDQIFTVIIFCVKNLLLRVDRYMI